MDFEAVSLDITFSHYLDYFFFFMVGHQLRSSTQRENFQLHALSWLTTQATRKINLQLCSYKYNDKIHLIFKIHMEERKMPNIIHFNQDSQVQICTHPMTSPSENIIYLITASRTPGFLTSGICDLYTHLNQSPDIILPLTEKQLTFL